jgi:DNA-binding transcriptional MerR regulator
MKSNVKVQMSRELFTLAELRSRARVSAKTLADWVGLKAISPSGYDHDRAPLFARDCLDRLVHIRRLKQLGYEPEDILRIIRKVGLPREPPAGGSDREPRNFLTVGNLAEQTGLSPRTIKHWEDKGIIEPDRRSEGGFRLYSLVYIYLCKLIQDLQLFGYSLEEIKDISGYFRDFLAIQKDGRAFAKAETAAKLDKMLAEIQALFAKMTLFKEGVDRWESLLKKKKREILGLRDRNLRRPGSGQENRHA